ncbi:hypothetical protein ALT761_03971 [Alteromonas sp. 76-1]|jgi:hypothetical protein|uniref:hypothetical protein n=1 Tax=Alteromonas sp. 76-1 TaxID=2358187 RepID=UPI000FD1882B|nr:hypothetical protein [Alteromonas sp. 76-1]VEL98936.1 hypothetical protein ALT761_03971 [Alteromonas sp. 76-1]
MKWIIFIVSSTLIGLYCFFKLFQPRVFIHVGDNVALAKVYIDASWRLQRYPFSNEKLSEISKFHKLPQGITVIQIPVIYNSENKKVPAPNNKDREVQIFDTSIRTEKGPLDPFSVSYTLRLISIDDRKYWFPESEVDSKLLQYKNNINFTPLPQNWFGSTSLH